MLKLPESWWSVHQRYNDFLCVSVQSDSALTVVENTGGGEEEAGGDVDEEVTVNEDEGDLEVVQPTEEWQTLKPGNVLRVLVLCHGPKHLILF